MPGARSAAGPASSLPAVVSSEGATTLGGELGVELVVSAPRGSSPPLTAEPISSARTMPTTTAPTRTPIRRARERRDMACWPSVSVNEGDVALIGAGDDPFQVPKLLVVEHSAVADAVAPVRLPGRAGGLAGAVRGGAGAVVPDVGTGEAGDVDCGAHLVVGVAGSGGVGIAAAAGDALLGLPGAEARAELGIVAGGSDFVEPLHEVGSDEAVDDDLAASPAAELPLPAVGARAHGPRDGAQPDRDLLAIDASGSRAEVDRPFGAGDLC